MRACCKSKWDADLYDQTNTKKRRGNQNKINTSSANNFHDECIFVFINKNIIEHARLIFKVFVILMTISTWVTSHIAIVGNFFVFIVVIFSPSYCCCCCCHCFVFLEFSFLLLTRSSHLSLAIWIGIHYTFAHNLFLGFQTAIHIIVLNRMKCEMRKKKTSFLRVENWKFVYFW